MFEESARAPLLISAPGIRGAGKASKSLVEFVDIYPTVAELGGLQAPSRVEGQSLVPLLNNPSRAWKKAAFTQMFDGKDITGRAVVTDRYRYIRWNGPHPDEELFDHANDPREYTNLIQKPGNEKLRARMAAILDAGWKAARA